MGLIDTVRLEDPTVSDHDLVMRKYFLSNSTYGSQVGGQHHHRKHLNSFSYLLKLI